MSESTQALDRPRKKAERIGLRQNKTSVDGDEASLDLGTVWETIKRSKWLILATCVVVTGLAAGITMMLPKIYKATAVVSVEEKGTGERVSPLVGLTGAPNLSSEIGILKNSGELARRVVSNLEAIDDTTKDSNFTVLQPGEGKDSLTTYEMAERLQTMVTFDAEEEEGLVAISAESESPEEAARIANIYAREYRSFSRETARAGVVAARKFLETQLEKRKEEIRQIEQEWKRFAENNAIATQGQDGQQVAQEYIELQTKRDAVEFELEQAKRRLEVLRSQLKESRPDLRSKVLEEQEVQSLRTQIQALEEQIAGLKAEAEQYYINDPSLRGNESRIPELAEIKRRIEGFENRKAELTENLVSLTEEAGLKVGDGTTTLAQMSELKTQIREQEMKVGQLEAQIEGLNQRINNYEGRVKGIPEQKVQREQLERRLSQAERFYTNIAQELQKTIVAEESELGFVKIIRSAVVPVMPVRPDLQQNLILGLLLGLGFGFGGAFVRQSMNWQIYEPDDIQEEGYSLVGVIPKMDREIKKAFDGDELVQVEGKRLSTRLFPLLNPWSPITENYRLVRTNLQYALNGDGNSNGVENPTLLMISSPEPGDGKTTTAVNLAITISLSGRSVLLVDADLRRPNAHRMLGMDESPGLADILTGTAESDVVRPTMVDGLSFVAAGDPDLPPTELLDTERMRTFLRRAHERYDVVIVDTPPILATTDPLVIAPFFEALLIVASADKTDFRSLSQVEKTLEAIGVPIGGIIFNRYDASKAGSSKKYGYGYDYTYDYARSTS